MPSLSFFTAEDSNVFLSVSIYAFKMSKIVKEFLFMGYPFLPNSIRS